MFWTCRFWRIFKLKILKKQFFLRKLFCFSTDLGLQYGNRSSSLRRSFRHLNIDCSSLLAKMTELRQNLHMWIFIEASHGEVSGEPLKIVLDPSNFLCVSGSLRRFCRHLNLDCSSILAKMTEFRQNLQEAETQLRHNL